MRATRPRDIVWADAALSVFEAAVARIAAEDERAAGRLVEAVDAAVAALARRNTGRPGRVEGTFEKSLPKWRYVIAFALKDRSAGIREIEILHLVHTSRDWPPGAWPR